MMKLASNVVDSFGKPKMLQDEQPIVFTYWPGCPTSEVKRCYLKDIECPNCKSKELVKCRDSEFPKKDDWGVFCYDCTINNRYPKEVVTRKREIFIAGLPEEFEGACFENLNGKSEMFMNFAKIYAKNPEGFLVIGGKPGIGKTYTAAAIMKEVAKLKDVRYIDAMDLYQKWVESKGSYMGLLETFQEIFFLTIDDFGHRLASDSYKEFLHMLFSRRKSTKKPTIILTNMNRDQLAENTNAAIYSRISSGITQTLDGEDRRHSTF